MAQKSAADAKPGTRLRLGAVAAIATAASLSMADRLTAADATAAAAEETTADVVVVAAAEDEDGAASEAGMARPVASNVRRAGMFGLGSEAVVAVEPTEEEPVPSRRKKEAVPGIGGSAGRHETGTRSGMPGTAGHLPASMAGIAQDVRENGPRTSL